MKATIAVIPGDGAGKEVVPQGVKALCAVAKRFHHEFDLRQTSMGFEAWKAAGNALPRETVEVCKSSQGILLGATGAARQEYTAEPISPGWGRLQLGRELQYCASVRPSYIYSHLLNKSPVKPEIIQGTDAIIVRHMRLTDEDEIFLILKFSFLLAKSRKKKLVLVAQSSSLQTPKLWSQLFTEIGQQFHDVEINAMKPDNCAAQLMRNPSDFDVIVCDNSSVGGMLNSMVGLLMGSVGMAPGMTVALRDGSTFNQMIVPNGMYEPIHGTAPLRAGQGIVNPIGTVLAAAMLLRYSLNLEQEARSVERAVEDVLAHGYRTYDIMEANKIRVGTEEMGNRIAAAIEH